ncbi:AbrB/MazE/SpoVT family DNA-binding domain-containing protein [Gandjariella thermophila]|nr:AbrB/MazE/SpoVT family DNA-binding domain-containing protein [Gandjariella thermophila]
MRLTSKGQVTIPLDVRRRLDLHPGDEVEFVVTDDGVRVVKSDSAPSRGSRIVERLRGRGDVHLTTDEIMALTRGE